MDRNDIEKKLLRELAEKNNSAYQFPQIEKSKESYFIERQETSYIREYGFETLPELFQELDFMWKDEKNMEQIKKIVGVAALKNKPSGNIQKSSTKGRNGRDERYVAGIYLQFLDNVWVKGEIL